MSTSATQGIQRTSLKLLLATCYYITLMRSFVNRNPAQEGVVCDLREDL